MPSVRFPNMGSSELVSWLSGLLGLFGFSGLAVENGFSGSRGLDVEDVVAEGVAGVVEVAVSKRMMSCPTREVFN